MNQQRLLEIGRGIALAFSVLYQDHRFSAEVREDQVWVVFFGQLLIVQVDEAVAAAWLEDDIRLDLGGAPA